MGLVWIQSELLSPMPLLTPTSMLVRVCYLLTVAVQSIERRRDVLVEPGWETESGLRSECPLQVCLEVAY
jgi:hypothetical protein